MCCFKAGGITQKYINWTKIGASDTVLSWIRLGVKLMFECEPAPFEIENRQLSHRQTDFITQELQRLISINAIERCVVKPRWCSPIGSVPKKGGKERLITDLRVLNKYCRAPKFNNEDIRVAQEYIQYNDVLATIDLQDGFYHISIRPEDRQYLGFKWQGTYYQWKVLPFGLSLSPWYFAKIIRPIVTYLRSLGVRLQAYVDDFLLASHPATFTDHLDLLLNTLKDLGWKINEKKSSLLPEHEKVYIGYKIKTNGKEGLPSIQISLERIRKLRRSLHKVCQETTISARNLARIAGQCVAMSFVINPAKLLLRNVYRLLQQRDSWETKLVITKEAKQDLSWWAQYVTRWNFKPVVVRPIEVQITTDASHLGWGAVCNDQEALGQWNYRLSQKSSNHRELMAILMALRTFLCEIKDKSVQIRTDNMTAMAYIMNKGGPSVELTDIAKAIWALAFKHNIEVEVRHLSGVNNAQADRLSRVFDRFNWMLHPGLFRILDMKWGPHTVDRFADSQNSQLPRFNSRFMDPYAEAVDALAQTNWAEENNYINPPFCLLPRVMEKIKQSGASATVIAPLWRSQPWFHQMMKMLKAPPLRIPKTSQAIRFMGPNPEVFQNRGWKIFAWRLCGKKD